MYYLEEGVVAVLPSFSSPPCPGGAVMMVTARWTFVSLMKLFYRGSMCGQGMSRSLPNIALEFFSGTDFFGLGPHASRAFAGWSRTLKLQFFTAAASCARVRDTTMTFRYGRAWLFFTRCRKHAYSQIAQYFITRYGSLRSFKNNESVRSLRQPRCRAFAMFASYTASVWCR